MRVGVSTLPGKDRDHAVRPVGHKCLPKVVVETSNHVRRITIGDCEIIEFPGLPSFTRREPEVTTPTENVKVNANPFVGMAVLPKGYRRPTRREAKRILLEAMRQARVY